MLQSRNKKIFPINGYLAGWKISHNAYIHRIEIQHQTIANTHPPLNYYAAHPATAPVARVAILHGYGDHAGRYAHLQQWFTERNIASFALDFRGHGRSGGKPGFVKQWDEHLTDLSAFLTLPELSTQNDPTPLFILAHSHGGLVATVAAMRGLLNHCQGVILSAPYLELKMPIPKLKRWVAKIAAVLHPSLPMKSGLEGPMLTRDESMIAQSRGDPLIRGIATPGWFFATQKTQAITRAMANQFNRPLLLLVPGQDTVADPQASVQFFEQCASADKAILHYTEHRHELLRELEREEIFQSIFDWIKNHLKQKTV
jgi:lysophospholipase